MALKPITPESLDRCTIVVIGPAGIGKTSLLRTIPEGESACVLSAEAGLLSVRDLVKAKLVTGFEIGSFSEMKEAFDILNNDPAFKEKYQWIFIDSLTEISSRCVEAMKAKYPSKSDSFNLWGEYIELMTMIIKGFRDIAHYSVVFSCLPSVEKDENNRRFIGPAISGNSLKERLTSYFDEVFYMTSQKDAEGNEHRVFITQPWERYPAKDRSGRLNLVEKPDLNLIKTKIFTEA